MKKYYFFATGCSHWFDVAKVLHQDGVASPIFWLGDDRNYKKVCDYFGNGVAVRMNDYVHRPWRLNNIEYDGDSSEFFFSENYIRAKDRCLKMMDRLDLYGLFTRLDREIYFNKLTITFLAKLKNSYPDALIMVDSPHSHAQYLLYEICQFFHIPMAKFNSLAMLVPGLILENITKNTIVENSLPVPNDIADRIDMTISNYVSSTVEKAKSGDYELHYIKKQRQQHKWWARLYSMLTAGSVMQYKASKSQLGMWLRREYNPVNPHNIGPLGRYRYEHSRRKNIRNNCFKYKDSPDLDKTFVYFALHYEPERTTNPDGGVFHDQIIAMVALRRFVPDNVEIVVKEQPTQFYERHRGHRGRSPLIYNLIKNIKGVRFLGPFENSVELQKKCVFVATITGSIAIEAAVLGKKTIMFGRTWFSGCPNTIAWDDCTDYQHLLDQKISDSNEVLKFLLDLRKRFSVVGYQNISLEKRYADYGDDEFYRYQRDGISGLLKTYFDNLS